MIARTQHKENAKRILVAGKSRAIGINVLSALLATANTIVFAAGVTAVVGIVTQIGSIFTLMMGAKSFLATALAIFFAALTDFDAWDVIDSLGELGDATIILAYVVAGFFTYNFSKIVRRVLNNALAGVPTQGNYRTYLYTAKSNRKAPLLMAFDGFAEFLDIALTYLRSTMYAALCQLPGLGVLVLAGLLHKVVGLSIFLLLVGLVLVWLGGWYAALVLWAMPWLKADCPDMSGQDCLRMSRQLCSPHLGDLLVYELSFLGWKILSRFTMGLSGVLYSVPYYRMTSALLYQELKGAPIALGQMDGCTTVGQDINVESLVSQVASRLNQTGAEMQNAAAEKAAAAAAEKAAAAAEKAAAAAATAPRMDCISGMYSGQSFGLQPNVPVVVGRDAQVAKIIITAGAEKVSRRHCTIRFNASSNQYELIDHSSNGVYVNGARLPHEAAVALARGTVISLGDNRNSFRLS